MSTLRGKPEDYAGELLEYYTSCRCCMYTEYALNIEVYTPFCDLSAGTEQRTEVRKIHLEDVFHQAKREVCRAANALNETVPILQQLSVPGDARIQQAEDIKLRFQVISTVSLYIKYEDTCLNGQVYSRLAGIRMGWDSMCQDTWICV